MELFGISRDINIFIWCRICPSPNKTMSQNKSMYIDQVKIVIPVAMPILTKELKGKESLRRPFS